MAQPTRTNPGGLRPHSTKREVVVIADDDEFFRMALRTILIKTLGDVEVIETSSLDEAVERLSETDNVSLALFDLAMPGMESAASLRAVRECFPEIRIAVVSGSKRRTDILLALEAGAHGYIPKGLGVTDLASAVAIVRSGVIYVPASIADLPKAEQTPQGGRSRGIKPQTDTGEIRLTPRRSEVLELLVRGLSNKEIARALRMGEGTVKVHVAALFRALGVTSRAAAAAAGTRLLKANET